MGKSFQGVFPVLLTPVDADGGLDIASLKKEVAFCIEAGAHGMVFPVLGSEFQFLSESERKELVEVVVGEAGGQIPVVAGVAGPHQVVAVEMAKHAAAAGADAVIALPPYIAAGSRDEIRAYYEAVAQAAARPVFIQHTVAGMDASFLQELLQNVENISYIKEEMQPSAHQISAVLGGVGDACKGVFAGGHDRWMMSEMHRGATGFMPATEAVDVHAQVWEAYQAGDEAGARRIFNQLLPLINQILLLGLRVCKEVLVRRGVIKTAEMRMPGVGGLDAEDERELDMVLADLQPLFRV